MGRTKRPGTNLKPVLPHHQKSIKRLFLFVSANFTTKIVLYLKRAQEMRGIVRLIKATVDDKNAFVSLLIRAKCALFGSSRRFDRGSLFFM